MKTYYVIDPKIDAEPRREGQTDYDYYNHQAYLDVSSCLEPRWTENSIYMSQWKFWRPLQKYPGD